MKLVGWMDREVSLDFGKVGEKDSTIIHCMNSYRINTKYIVKLTLLIFYLKISPIYFINIFSLMFSLVFTLVLKQNLFDVLCPSTYMYTKH